MTPAQMIANAKADGLTVFLDPQGAVKFRGTRAASHKWQPLLRLHKPALAALLQAPETVQAAWKAGDWRAYFDERAAVAEFDGAIPRRDAETQAYQCCVAEFLCRNPVTSEPGLCAWCGRGAAEHLPLLPYGDADNGHAWLHGECWPAWYARRRLAAVEALAGFGILPNDDD